jgi:hypothetical protein
LGFQFVISGFVLRQFTLAPLHLTVQFACSLFFLGKEPLEVQAAGFFCFVLFCQDTAAQDKTSTEHGDNMYSGSQYQLVHAIHLLHEPPPRRDLLHSLLENVKPFSSLGNINHACQDLLE